MGSTESRKQSRVRHVVDPMVLCLNVHVLYRIISGVRLLATRSGKPGGEGSRPLESHHCFRFIIIIIITPLRGRRRVAPAAKKEKKSGSSGGHAGGHRPTRACRPPAHACGPHAATLVACVQPAAIQPNPPTISSPVPARDGHPSIRPRRDAAPCVPVPSPRIGALLPSASRRSRSTNLANT